MSNPLFPNSKSTGVKAAYEQAAFMDDTRKMFEPKPVTTYQILIPNIQHTKPTSSSPKPPKVITDKQDPLLVKQEAQNNKAKSKSHSKSASIKKTGQPKPTKKRKRLTSKQKLSLTLCIFIWMPLAAVIALIYLPLGAILSWAVLLKIIITLAKR